MIPGSRLTAALLALLIASAGAAAASPQEAEPDKSRGDAYYHFSLAHLYEQLAMQYVRQEYIDRAIEEYKLAIEADPESSYLRRELIKLYAGVNRLDDAVAEANSILERDPKDAETHKLLGEIYRGYALDRRTGPNEAMLRTAIEHLEQALEISPRDFEALTSISTLYRVAGRNQEALEALETALEVDPESSEALTALAGLYIDTGEPEKGIEALERVNRAEGSDERRARMLADAYQKAGRHKEAAEVLQDLLDDAQGQGGNTLPIRRMLAESLMLGGELDLAVEQYEALLEAEPRSAEHHLRISQIRREQRRYSDAWDSLKEAQRLAPDSLEIKYNTVMLLEAERRLDDAIKGLEQILEDTEKLDYNQQERGTRAMFLEHLGALNRAAEDYDAANEAYARILELDPAAAPRVRALQVDNLRSARRYDDALEASKKAVDHHDDNRQLIIQRATLLAESGEAEQAAAILSKLLDDSPADLEIYLTLAQVYEKGKMFEEGLQAIQKAEALADNDRKEQAVLFAHASLLERAKRHEESEAKFRELLEKDPDNSSALNYLGYMLADLNVKLDEAHDMIQRALDLEPDNGAYLDSLGWVYYRQDKLKLAERYLKRSLEQFGTDPVVHTHMGDVYFKLGDKERARKHWERSLEEWRKNAVADRDAAEIQALKEKLTALGVKVSKFDGDPEPVDR